MRKHTNDSKRDLPNTAVDTLAAEQSAAHEAALAVFGNWLDGELEKLVARWVHLAAPNANARERALRRANTP